MKILVINCGSSSLKYQLIDTATETALASGLIERLGEPRGILTHKNRPGAADESQTVREEPIPDHEAGLRLAQAVMADPVAGVRSNASDIQAVAEARERESAADSDAA